jgi:hypothetical protein
VAGPLMVPVRKIFANAYFLRNRCILGGIAVLLITIPIFQKVGAHFSIDPVPFGVVMTLASMIRHLIAAVFELISLFFLIIFFYQALRLTILAKDWTPVFQCVSA